MSTYPFEHSLPGGMPSIELQRAIDESDCVLALVTVGTSAHMDSELSYALSRGRLVIPIVEHGVTLSPGFNIKAIRSLRLLSL